MKFLLLIIIATLALAQDLVDRDKVILTLFTKHQGDLLGRQILADNLTPEALTAAGYRPGDSTRILIHDLNGNDKSTINTKVKAAYVNHLISFNVIVVDYSGTLPTEILRDDVIRVVGLLVADVIKSIREGKDITIVGHGVGAHIAGYAGRLSSPQKEVDSIVSLDPSRDTALAIKRGDADYLHTIYTTRQLTLSFGDAAFYPNFYPLRAAQPGCGVDRLFVCSHERAVELFAESIKTSGRFLSNRCGNIPNLPNILCFLGISFGNKEKMGGEPLDKTVKGVYHLTTSGASPYYK